MIFRLKKTDVLSGFLFRENHSSLTQLSFEDNVDYRKEKPLLKRCAATLQRALRNVNIIKIENFG